jgi:predicted kinase
MQAMTEHSEPPLLVIVNGRPATGKTRLAERLSAEFGIPLFTKDAVKELLGDVVGAADRDAAHTLGHASIVLIFQHAEAVLATGAPAIVECPLIPELSADPVRELQERTGCRILQIFLKADPDVILRRYDERDRNEVHFDEEARKELELSLRQTEVDPVPIDGETIHLDTTDFDDAEIEMVFERVRAAL